MFNWLPIKRYIPAAGVTAALAAALLLPTASFAAVFTTYSYSYSYGGTLRSGPSAASGSSTNVEVFAHGTDDGLWQAAFVNGAFGGWTSLGGVLALDPASASPAMTNSVYVFVEGTDGATWTRKSADNGATWSAWSSLGGITIAGPGAAASFQSPSTLRVDVFVVGSDSAIYTQSSADGVTYGGWSKIGGYVTEKPGAVSMAPGRVDLFVRGSDMGLWTMTITNGTPGAWTSLGGTLLSGVAASSCNAGNMDLYVVGTGGSLWHLGWSTAGGFAAWDQNNLGGTWTSNLGAVCQAGTKNVTVYGAGTDGALWSWNALGS